MAPQSFPLPPSSQRVFLFWSFKGKLDGPAPYDCPRSPLGRSNLTFPFSWQGAYTEKQISLKEIRVLLETYQLSPPVPPPHYLSLHIRLFPRRIPPVRDQGLL